MAKARTVRLTMAQALIGFLQRQYVRRDGRRTPFFAGVWGIFGHGNLAGVGQALQEHPDFPYYLSRNEQAQVHVAAAYAKAKRRLQTFACTSSIGPGATNMVTGAALATINRLPVLLLPGDIFAKRNVAPVLQQLEQPYSLDVSVNDAFRPVCRYFDRIYRPDQLPYALMEAMRVLTSPAETGAVTLALPQDTQAEAYDYPAGLLAERVWPIRRPPPEKGVLQEAVRLVRKSRRPLIIAGGGVLYSEAEAALRRLVEKTGIPVCETQAGKGALAWDHPQNLGAVGATGGSAANLTAREADLVIALGTRLSDFPTASKTAFQHPRVRFLAVNVCEVDAYKHAALPVVADARAMLEALGRGLTGFRVSASYAAAVEKRRLDWNREVSRLFDLQGSPRLIQSEVLGVLNASCGPKDVVVCASGSLPGDLHKLWRVRDPGGYHLEYGYSCMGYEVAGAVGVKMAEPEREVYCLVGDGAFLMMSSEIVTAVQEGIPINVVLLDNHGYASIGGLSASLGSEGFGTHYRLRRRKTGRLDGELVPTDFVKLSEGYGAWAVKAEGRDELRHALEEAKRIPRPRVIVVEVEREARVPGYASWWDVPPAQVSRMESVRQARRTFEKQVLSERDFF